MYDRYIICEDSLRPTEDGFAFDVRIAYYRGVRLALVEEIDVRVDGEEVPRDQRRFGVPGGAMHSFDELETVFDERWEMAQPATIEVVRPGGLAPGHHRLEVSERIRISYGNGYARASDAKDVILSGDSDGR